MKRLAKDILIIGIIFLIIISLGKIVFPHTISIIVYGFLMFGFGYIFAKHEFKK